MSNTQLTKNATQPSNGWSDLWKKEDYWAVWLGLGLVFAVIFAWNSGSSFFKWIAVSVPAYTDFSKATLFVSTHLGAFFGLFVLLSVIFSIAIKILGHNLKEYLPGFAILFVISIIVTVLGSWSVMKKYNLETPLLALAVGLVIGNLIRLPKWLDTSLRTEFYV